MTKIFALFALCLVLAACGGGHDDPEILFRDATEVRAAFLDKGRAILPAVGERIGPEPRSMVDSSEFEFRGGTSQGVSVVLTQRYAYRSVPASKVSVGGVFVPALQNIPARIAGQDYPAPILEIREYQGWLLIYASLRPYTGGMNWRIERWVAYRPDTQQFVDCGELDSIRPAEWGPATSSSCVQR